MPGYLTSYIRSVSCTSSLCSCKQVLVTPAIPRLMCLMCCVAVGVIMALCETGVLKSPAQLAGASAGSLIAASYNSGLSMETVRESMIKFGEDCLAHGTRYRYGEYKMSQVHAC